jgi:hypothetical protein
MKRLSTLYFFLGCLVACSGKDRTAEFDDIREATFRYQFVKNASVQQQNAQVYFLSVIAAGKKEAEDPSDEFMKRFAGHKPRVVKHTESKSSMEEGVRDKKSGERGLSFHVGEIRWNSDTEVEVDGGYYEGGESASGNTYFLKKKHGKWVVERDVMHWIAWKRPNKSPEAMALAVMPRAMHESRQPAALPRL